MSEIKYDPNNARIHTPNNQDLIKKSLEKHGAGRSILLDKDNTIIAGNGVFEQSKELGIPIKIIKSDGSELIAIQRTDLDYDDPSRRSLAIADNATTDSSVWDFDILTKDEAEEWEILWEEEIDFSEKNKEIDVGGFDDAMKISLSYTEEEYHIVKDSLLSIAKTPEAAVWDMLKEKGLIDE